MLQGAVILCHGLSSHKDGFHLPALAQALQERGVSSLRIDFSGNGESEVIPLIARSMHCHHDVEEHPLL